MVIKMLKNQTYQLKEAERHTISLTKALGICLLSFVISGTSILSELSPLNVALSAASSFTGSLVVFAASIVSYMFNGIVFDAIPQICSMLCICAVKFIIAETSKGRTSAFGAAFMSSAFMLIFGVIFQFVQHNTTINIIGRVAQGLLCGCTAYFCVTIVKRFRSESILPVAGLQGASLAAIFVLLTSTLTSIDLFSVNIGRVFGMLVILFAIKKYKQVGGAICGALTTCGVVLCSFSLGESTILLAVVGLISGLFVELGTLPFLLSFIAANFVSITVIGATQSSFNMLVDTAVATIVFIIIPSAAQNKILQCFETTAVSSDLMAQSASKKMMFAAKTINEVRISLDKISTVMDKKMAEKDFVSKASVSVCSDCPDKLNCWNNNYQKVNDCFLKIQQKLEEFGYISVGDFPREFDFCGKISELENSFNLIYREVCIQKKQEQKLREMRNLLSEQFLAMEESVSSLGKQISEYSAVEPVYTKRVNAYFEKKAFRGANACVFMNSTGKMIVEVYILEAVKMNEINLCSDISLIVERDLELPIFTTAREFTRIEMWEKPEFLIETAGSQFAGSDNEVSGDSYELFSDNQAQSYIILSDGMGSGKRAQLDSTLASSLVSTLVRSGIGCSSSIRMINSYLRVKNWEESFTTLDIAIINHYEATLSIIKAGASATYILRSGKLKKLEISSMPIGILQDINPVKIKENLFDGDLIITASDGLPDSYAEQLKEIATAYKKCSAKEISNRITERLFELKTGEHCDDITIIVTKVTSNI